MRILGIDPGLGGAYAVLENNEIVWTRPFPLRPDVKGKNDIDTVALYNDLIAQPTFDLVVLEGVHGMPGDGPVGAFTFGRTVGKLRAIVELLNVPLIEPSPQKWKGKVLAGTDKSKEAAIGWAKNRYPKANLLRTPACRKPDHNVAEAIAMAEFGRLHLLGQA